MGVGLPFGIGAKIAKPDKQVIVVHGDGSFGLNALELDTAVRHNIPILIVVSLNGGWTADPDRNKPGRNLGYTRFDKMAEALGCYGEYVERPDEIRLALDRRTRIERVGLKFVELHPCSLNAAADRALISSTSPAPPCARAHLQRRRCGRRLAPGRFPKSLSRRRRR